MYLLFIYNKQRSASGKESGKGEVGFGYCEIWGYPNFLHREPDFVKMCEGQPICLHSLNIYENINLFFEMGYFSFLHVEQNYLLKVLSIQYLKIRN